MSAQYLLSGPSFGGMSGVVYGLLGYIWMQGRFNPASGLSLQPQTVTMMILWFFLCLTGMVGHVANTVHAVGLAGGIAWGFLDAQLAIMSPAADRSFALLVQGRQGVGKLFAQVDVTGRVVVPVVGIAVAIRRCH